MRTKVTEMFGIETPIFAFSHCRDVVVEVTNAGGIGVLGTTRLSPEQLEEEQRRRSARRGKATHNRS
jgi:NAD(P)H-dependent flavin oxidoreductase YrpB (nitropropane dioxygenase family)